MPGGADLPYCRDLNAEGNALIRGMHLPTRLDEAQLHPAKLVIETSTGKRCFSEDNGFDDIDRDTLKVPHLVSSPFRPF